MTDRPLVTRLWAVLSAAVVALGVVAASGETTPLRLTDVSVGAEPDGLTIHVKTSGVPKYRAELIDRPARLVLDLESTSYGWRKTPLDVGVEPIKQIRGSQYRRGIARVVFELTQRTGYAIREEAEGLAIVIPLQAAGPAPKSPASPKASTAPAASPATAPVLPAVRLAQAPTPPPVPPPAPAPSRRLISLDFKDADIVNLLRILAAESGKNIVVGDDVKGKVSISLHNVPWQQALETVLESRGLEKLERDNIIRIVSTEQLAKEREAKARVEEAKVKAETELRTKMAEAVLKEQEVQARKLAAEAAAAEAQARGPLREETFRLSYADPEEVVKTLQGILGIPAEGIAASTTPIAPPPTEPPFSAVFGPGGASPPPAPRSPSADVLAKGITIRAHKPTNSIFIRHYEKDLEGIKKLIREKLDIPLPQVKIEARMEILRREDLEAIGVKWGGGGVFATTAKGTVVGRGLTLGQDTTTGIRAQGGSTTGGLSTPNPGLTLTSAVPVSAATGLPAGGNIVNLPISSLLGGAASTGAGGVTFGIIGSRLNINLALEALRSESKTRTLARPEIVTVENAKATISLGEEIPYATISSAGTQVSFREAVLKLEVTPTVIYEGDLIKIKMKIVVENNSRGSTVDLGNAGSPPAIDKRKAETEVLIKEGERLVIGGVTKGVSVDAIRKVPLLGDIPLLGWLFKQKGQSVDDTELVVFITPSVLKTDGARVPLPKTETPRRP